MLCLKLLVVLLGVVGLFAYPVEDEDQSKNLRRYLFPADLGSPIVIICFNASTMFYKNIIFSAL